MFLSPMTINSRLGKDNQLLKLNDLINWDFVGSKLKVLQKDTGRDGYPAIKMFKALLLGQWHSLSDPGLENSLKVRLDFMEFTGFSLTDEIPDETTICRYRNKLISHNILDVLFNEINRQLEDNNLKIKNAEQAIVDATLIDSCARPKRVIEIDVDRQENSKYSVSINESVDHEARWLKKGNKFHYGYKLFARTDAEGYIEKVHLTPANHSEVKEFPNIVQGCTKGRELLGDKGYSSAANREFLKNEGIKDGVMRKASRGNPLSQEDKTFNKVISKVRYRVEQTFGTLKRRFSYGRSSYLGKKKTLAQIYLKSMCLNLLKAINKVQVTT